MNPVIEESAPDPIGVLFMAYGGPDTLEDIGGYLADIRSGRPTPTSLLEEITRNYRLIGGSSPLLALTREAIDAVMHILNPPAAPPRYKAYLGMRHWAPWIEETVGQMIDDGIERAVSLVLAPHYSGMSIAKYQKKIEAGLRLFRGAIAFENIDSYHNAPGLIAALADRVRQGLDRWSEKERNQVHVVFSAHSLPVRILESGDPYDLQVRETAELVAAKAGLADDQWSWSYQSAGRSPEPWLGPQLEDYLPTLAARGITSVVSIPVGFVCDHVEVLYDIDIEAQQVAKEQGIRLERPPALNADPVFIAQLADLIQRRATGAGWLP